MLCKVCVWRWVEGRDHAFLLWGHLDFESAATWAQTTGTGTRRRGDHICVMSSVCIGMGGGRGRGETTPFYCALTSILSQRSANEFKSSFHSSDFAVILTDKLVRCSCLSRKCAQGKAELTLEMKVYFDFHRVT